jgi:hypothetical protein
VTFDTKKIIFIFIRRNLYEKTKSDHLLFEHPMRINKDFFQSFLVSKWITYFMSFLAIPSTSNSNSMWVCDELLFQVDREFIFLVYFEELLYVATWLKLPKDWKVGCQKEVCNAHKILNFCLWFSMLPSMWLLGYEYERF